MTAFSKPPVSKKYCVEQDKRCSGGVNVTKGQRSDLRVEAMDSPLHLSRHRSLLKL